MKLALCLAFALAACGSKEPTVEEPVTPSAEPPTGETDPKAPGNGICPAVRLSEAGHTAKGTPLDVTVTVDSGDPNVSPTYNWSVSAGGIESGQGTPKISIGTADVDGNLTITVDVGGYDPSCTTSASTTTHVM
jgi:hypothetical protein